MSSIQGGNYSIIEGAESTPVSALPKDHFCHEYLDRVTNKMKKGSISQFGAYVISQNRPHLHEASQLVSSKANTLSQYLLGLRGSVV